MKFKRNLKNLFNEILLCLSNPSVFRFFPTLWCFIPIILIVSVVILSFDFSPLHCTSFPVDENGEPIWEQTQNSPGLGSSELDGTSVGIDTPQGSSLVNVAELDSRTVNQASPHHTRNISELDGRPITRGINQRDIPLELDGRAVGESTAQRVVPAELDGRAVNRSSVPSCLRPGYQEVNTRSSIGELGGSSNQACMADLPELQGREMYRPTSYHGSDFPVDNSSSMDAHCSAEEVEVFKPGVLGKIRLGFLHKEAKLESIYIKYHDMAKRKFFWTVWAKDSGNYRSYEEFKKSWDPNTKIWSAIKKETKSDLRDEINDLLRVKRPFDRPLDNTYRKHIRGSANRKHRR